MKDLLRKVKYIHTHDQEFKWHHAFLTNVPILYYKKFDYSNYVQHAGIDDFISALAHSIYEMVAVNYMIQAAELLAKIQPDIYSTLNDPSYHRVIVAYSISSSQPIDCSYLWEPQEFCDFLNETLPDLISLDASNYIQINKFSFERSSILSHRTSLHSSELL